MSQEFQDAFISYGRADSKLFATRLHQCLSDKGLKVWFDQNDIPLAVDFQNQIDDGITRSDNFLFIIAPHSVHSPYCRKEIELALQQNKRIIPLLHVEQITQETWQQRHPNGTLAEWEAYQAKGLYSSFTHLHPAIGKINWVYFREGIDDFEQSLAGLLEIFERQKHYVHQHTVLLAQALEWEQHQKQTRCLLIGEERQQAEAWLKVKFQQEQPPCLPTDLHCEFITESIKNANNLMTQVFLAYAESDTAIMEQLRNSLRRAGLTVWTNKTDIQTGAAFQESIDRGIEEADNVVYLLSPDAVCSEYCQREIDYALTLNKRIIPVLVRPTDLMQVPEALRNLQYIDLSDNVVEADYQQNESQLLRILCQDVAYYEEHKILLAKALKWQRQHHNPSILLRGYNLRHAEAWLKVGQQRQQHRPTPFQEAFIQESLRQPPAVSLDVFVSYSRADSDFARRLNDALQIQGKRTWFDQESIASGTDFQQEIYRGIESSDTFLFILSPSSVSSPYCADEVEYAQKLNKRVVTVLHRPVESANLHPVLAAVQWLDFNQREGDFSANFKELLRVLDTDQAHLHAHTRLLVRAIEWDSKGRKDSFLLRGDDLAEAEQWLAQGTTRNPQPTDLHQDYITTSRNIEAVTQKANQILQEAARKGSQRVLIGTIAMGVGLAIAAGASLFAFFWIQKVEEAKVGIRLELDGINALRQLEFQQLEALLSAVRAGQELKVLNKGNRPLEQYPATSPLLALQTILDSIQEQAQLKGHQEWVISASFSPDGKRVVTASGDSTARVWDVSGKQLAELKGHQEWVRSASFSPDGKRVVTASDDKTARVWDVSGKQLAELKGHQGMVLSASFSPDGKRIVTASNDGTARIWRADDLDQLLARGCDWLSGYLQNSPDLTEADRRICDGVTQAQAR